MSPRDEDDDGGEGEGEDDRERLADLLGVDPDSIDAEQIPELLEELGIEDLSEIDREELADLRGIADLLEEYGITGIGDHWDVLEVGERTLIYVDHLADADAQLELELQEWEDEEKYERA